MYCPNCGAGLPDDSRFCAECGTPVGNLAQTAVSPAVSDNAGTQDESIPASEAEQPAAAPAETEQPAAAPAETEQPKSVYESVVGNMALGAVTPISGQPVTENVPQANSVIPVQTADGMSEAAPQILSIAPEYPVQPVYSVPDQTVPVSAAAPEAPAQPAPKKSGKKILLIAGIALVLVILGVTAFFVIRNFLPTASNGGFSYAKRPLMITSEEEVQIYNGSAKPVTIDGGYESSQYSMDETKCVLSVDADEDGNGTLFYYDGKKAVELSDDVYGYNISANGNVVGYITDYDRDESSGTLNIYDAATGKSKEAAEDVLYGILLSPDGKSYAYNSDIEMDEYGSIESMTAYVSVNGKEAEPLDSDMQVVGLSNSANYLYYVEMDDYSDPEGKLYVRHGKSDTKIGTADMDENFIFNQDLSEVLYTNNESTYYSKAGGDKEEIADLPVSYMLVPENTQITYLYNICYCYLFNVKSLTAQMYYFYDYDTSEMMIGYLNGKCEFSEIDSASYYDTFQTQIAANGKGLYYLDDSGKIKYYKNVSDSDSKPVKIDGDDDIISFIVSSDQKTVYFVDNDETLWVKHGSSDPVDVADDVMSYSLQWAADGKGVYFISDYSVDDETYVNSGTLCYLSNAKDAKVTEIEEDVSSVEVSDFGVAYYVFDEMSDSSYYQLGEAFYSRDGKKFESVMDDALFW